ncbi:MAG: diaminopimelate epimerase [Flavobacteriales bacterium]
MIPFYKYHGAGNDFVIIDDRESRFDTSDVELISKMCNRHFGIGADGLMLLREINGYDFEMVYFNSDGRPSSMCGNGGRCLVSFAAKLGVVSSECKFMAVDGEHKAVVHSQDDISLEMIDVDQIENIGKSDLLLNTGSPHYIVVSDDVDSIDLVTEARKIRYSDRFKEVGVNVNFIQRTSDGIQIRTYERGVEAETLACGTGVTAAAIASHELGWFESPVTVNAVGGKLNVSFDVKGHTFFNVWKRGPVELVFEGQYFVEGGK